jgi:hypothetical protein
MTFSVSDVKANRKFLEGRLFFGHCEGMVKICVEALTILVHTLDWKIIPQNVAGRLWAEIAGDNNVLECSAGSVG